MIAGMENSKYSMGWVGPHLGVQGRDLGGRLLCQVSALLFGFFFFSPEKHIFVPKSTPGSWELVGGKGNEIHLWPPALETMEKTLSVHPSSGKHWGN